MIDRDRALIERLKLTDEDRALIESVTGTRIDEHVKVLMCTVEDLAALLSAARDEGRAEGLGGWEPIETVPNNTDHMRPILVFWKSRGVQQTYWDVDEDFQNRPKGWRSPECGWRCDGDQCIPVNQDDATHWMRFPAPPASQTQEG